MARLISTGPSTHGWSRIGAFRRCPRLYAYRTAGIIRAESDALLRGTILHTGLAHHYARVWCRQNGVDPAEYCAPEDAMALVDQGREDLRRLATGALHAYLEAFAGEDFHVVSVEKEFVIAIHEHPYSARFDLVIEDRAGGIWAMDHKSTIRMDNKLALRYQISGQILGQLTVGRAIWGERFQGVRINVLPMTPPHTPRRITPDPAPRALAEFPETVRATEAAIAALGDMPIEAYPMAIHEQVCVSAYGACEAFELCAWGPGTCG